MREVYDEARRCFEEARADGGESASDPVANLLSLALAEGDEEQVSALDAELRRMARAVRTAAPRATPPTGRRRGRRACRARWP